MIPRSWSCIRYFDGHWRDDLRVLSSSLTICESHSDSGLMLARGCACLWFADIPIQESWPEISRMTGLENFLKWNAKWTDNSIRCRRLLVDSIMFNIQVWNLERFIGQFFIIPMFEFGTWLLFCPGCFILIPWHAQSHRSSLTIWPGGSDHLCSLQENDRASSQYGWKDKEVGRVVLKSKDMPG
jgi:hypothetical protein